MAIRTAQTLNLPRKELAAGEKRLAEFKAEQMRPRTALERLVEEGPVTLKDQPSYIQKDPKAYLARPQDLTNPEYRSPKPGELEAQQEAREQWARNVEMRAIQDEAETENIARDQRELERQTPIAQTRQEILLGPKARDPMSDKFAWAGLSLETQAQVNTLLNDGFGQSIKRGDLFVKAIHNKIAEADVIAAGKVDYEGAEKDYAGTDVKMAFTEPKEASTILKATMVQQIDQARASLPTSVDERGQPKPVVKDSFKEYLKEFHPDIKWNPLTLKAILFSPDKLNAGIWARPNIKVKALGRYMLADPQFVRIMNYVIEKNIFQEQFVPMEGEYERELMAAGVMRPAQLDLFDQDNPSSREGPAPSIVTTKTSGAARLGREIYKEWQRELNRKRGRPTDEYDLNSLTDDEFETIGAFAKETWQSINPDLMTTDQTGEIIKYQLTPKGREALKQAALAAPDAFKTEEIPPTRISEAEVGGRTGEARRSRTTTEVIKPDTPHKKIEVSRTRMESVDHTVATKRTKLFYQVGLQAMISAKSQSDLDSLGDLVKLGPEKMAAFKGEFERKVFQLAYKKKIDKEDARKQIEKEYDPAYEMDKQFTRFIETLNTLARYSDGAWKLKFAHQSLQDRMHVIQTRFNPQGNPWIRFATGGVTPTSFDPKSNSDENNVFKELMAKTFIPGGKNATPEKRLEMFNQELNKLDNPDSLLSSIAADGKTVEESLMDADTYKATTEALKKIGLAVNPQQQQRQMFNPETNQYETATATTDYIRIPEELAQTPRLNIPDSLLSKTRDSKGASEEIDGLYKIEAAMELARWLDSRKNGTQFSTDINIEFDGKTHGIASYLASLGNLKAAYRTGVTREAGSGENLGPVPVTQLAGVEGQIFTYAGFNIKELGEGTFEFTDQDGNPRTFHGAVYNEAENMIYVSKDDLMKKWNEKSWTKPRKQRDGSFAKPLPADAFKNFDELVEFVKFHESMHARKQVDNKYAKKGNESIGQYETRINNYAWNELQKHRRILSEADLTSRAGDLRDAVGYYALGNGREYAANAMGQTDANIERFYRILELAIDDKTNFLKQPIMTLSYGQLIQNLDAAIIDTVFAGKNSNGLKDAMGNPTGEKGIMDIIQEMEAEGSVNLVTYDPGGKEVTFENVEDAVIKYLHNVLVDGIDSELHPGVQAVGQALRATNVVAMLSNGIMSIENALGFPSYIGAKETKVRIDPVTGKKVLSDIHVVTTRTDPQTGKRIETRGVSMADTVPSGSALREGQLAGWGRGRIIPAIIQAMDGAWMNKMFRGESWEKLQGGYILPIFDAVKVDVKTAAEARRQANKNWWDTVKNYKPWRSLFIDWTDKQIYKYEKELDNQIQAGNTPIRFENIDKAFRNLQRPDSFSTFMQESDGSLRALTGQEERLLVTNKAKKELDQFKPYYLLLHANQSNPDHGVRIGDLNLSPLTQLFEDTIPFRARNKGERIDQYVWEKKKYAHNQAKWVVEGRILDQMKAAQPEQGLNNSMTWRGAKPINSLTPEQMQKMFRRIVHVLKIKKVPDINAKIKDSEGNLKPLNAVYQSGSHEAIVKSIETSHDNYVKKVGNAWKGQIDMG